MPYCSQVVEKWTAITTKPAAGGESQHADAAKEGADGMPPPPPTQTSTELDSNSTSADSVPPPAPAAVVTGPPTIV